MATPTRRSKINFLRSVFATLPCRYDLINRIITFGLYERWSREAAKRCLTSRPGRVLDLCCGTGGLAINLARLAENAAELVGVDYSQLMLRIAARKSKSLAGGRTISFIRGDAANLPFVDGCFNSIGISFAFRNLTYENPLAQRYLAEIFRLLNVGGRFIILETSQPRLRLIRRLYHLYLYWFVSKIGYLLSGNREAYQYLAESTARFHTPKQVEEMLAVAGFREVSFRPLLLGAVCIHIAVK